MYNLDVIFGDSPPFVRDGLIFLARGGSCAYGTMVEGSDIDIYGITIPPNEILHPWKDKFVGFDEASPFLHWKPTGDGMDRTIYSLPRFFKLVSEGNPNILEMLYYPKDCWIHTCWKWNYIVEHRGLFLSKEIHSRFTGFAYSNIKRLKSAKSTSSKRIALHEKFGYNCKDASNVIRILYNLCQLLSYREMDLRMYSQQILEIKQGKWSYERVIDHAESLMELCDERVQTSKLPSSPPIKEIRALLEHLC